MERVLCLILHHGRPAALRRCLASLAASRRVPDQVLVVDNGSGDGEAAVQGVSLPAGTLRVLASGRNLGFAGGVNLGLAAARGDDWHFALLLNDDAMVRGDCLTRLLRAAARDPRAGLLGAEIRSARDPGRLESTGLCCSPLTGRVHSLDAGRRANGATGPAVERAALSGCALLVRREALAAAGGPDASLFLYFEDLEWSVRLARSGFRLLHVPGALAFHEGGRLGGPDRVYYSTRNQLRVVRALHPLPAWLDPLRTLSMVALNLAAVARTAPDRPLAGVAAWGAGLRDGLSGRGGPRDRGGAHV